MNPKTFQQTRQAKHKKSKQQHIQAQKKKNGDRALSTQVPELEIDQSQSSNFNLNDSEQQIKNRILNYEEQEDLPQSHDFRNQQVANSKNKRDPNFKRGNHQSQGKSQQMYLSLKVNQLQNMCSALSQTNKKLLNKINSLDQSQQSLPFIDEFSEMQGQFSQVEHLIHQYREHLAVHQEKLQADIVNKNSLIQSLKQQVANLVQTNATISEQSIELQKSNEELIKENQDLQLQIYNLKAFYQGQRQKQRKSIQTYSRVYGNQNNFKHTGTKYIPQSYSSRQYRDRRMISQPRMLDRYNFQRKMNIQYDNESQHSRMTQIQRLKTQNHNAQESAREQMEILIQRLVNELEHQKKIKNKMSQQIKRLNRQLMIYQKQILDKNNKIYFLQLNAIRSGKTLRTSKSTTQFEQRESLYNMSSLNQREDRSLSRNHSQNHLMHSFPLINLLKKEIVVSDSAKIQIARKIVSLYQRKLQQTDYKQIMTQEIQVMNFNQSNLDILYVRQIGKRNDKQVIKSSIKNSKEQQKQAHSLLFNMAFCLDNLFNEVPDSNQGLIQTIKGDFLQMLQNILSNNGSKNSITQSLSELSLFLDKAFVNMIKNSRG